MIKSILKGSACVFVGLIVGSTFTQKKNKRIIAELKNENRKKENLFRFMKLWVNAKGTDKVMEEYLISKGIQNVALYGLGNVGQTVIEELKNGEITIRYGIDRNWELFCEDFKVISPEDELMPVDAIIVTPIMEYESIKNALSEKVRIPIYSIEEIVEKM